MAEVWTPAECAAFLKCSPKHFLHSVRFKEGFPPPLPWSVGYRPKWSSEEVKAWKPPAKKDRWARQTTLYRHYAANGELLYVGISLSHMTRMAAHRCKARWFQQVANITLEHFDSFSAARKAEQEAIRAERPRYNTQHSRK
jgi:hypothetical protein